ncbi:MAG: protein BatD [Lentisphaerae bacterium]|nr:protein BatD [Lentisphaerota bacterium]
MKSTFRFLLALTLSLCIPARVRAQIQQATLRFDPETPFVGQPFTLILDVTVTPGVELENLNLEGLPDPSLVRFINFVAAERKGIRADGGTAADVLRYTAEGQASRAFVTTVTCTLRGQVVERVSRGVFSHMRSYPVTYQISSARLNVRDLPSQGRPPDFSGAIGRFTLSGDASPQTVSPGDLVTLSYVLTGNGWLADATLVPPDPGSDFKTYPAQETAREARPPRLSFRQVVIPLSTNATVVGTPRFVYFDPDTAAYRTAMIEPFRLTFAHTTTAEPAIRRIDITPAARPSDGNRVRPPELAIAETVAKIRQLVPLASALILAAAVTGMLFRVRRIPAVIAGLLILALGVAASRRFSQAAEARALKVGTSVTARLAPSDRACPLFDLHPGASVLPLEHTPGWVRVRAADREAWIPVTSVTHESSEMSGVFE